MGALPRRAALAALRGQVFRGYGVLRAFGALHPLCGPYTP